MSVCLMYFVETPPPDWIIPHQLKIEGRIEEGWADDTVKLVSCLGRSRIDIPIVMFQKRDIDPAPGMIVRVTLDQWSDGETNYQYMSRVSVDAAGMKGKYVLSNVLP